MGIVLLVVAVVVLSLIIDHALTTPEERQRSRSLVLQQRMEDLRREREMRRRDMEWEMRQLRRSVPPLRPFSNSPLRQPPPARLIPPPKIRGRVR